MIVALQHRQGGGDLGMSEFAKEQHNSFWMGARQKALALCAGHSQVFAAFNRELEERVLVLPLSNAPCTLPNSQLREATSCGLQFMGRSCMSQAVMVMTILTF